VNIQSFQTHPLRFEGNKKKQEDLSSPLFSPAKLEASCYIPEEVDEFLARQCSPSELSNLDYDPGQKGRLLEEALKRYFNGR
jgi:hypothetical protein